MASSIFSIKVVVSKRNDILCNVVQSHVTRGYPLYSDNLDSRQTARLIDKFTISDTSINRRITTICLCPLKWFALYKHPCIINHIKHRPQVIVINSEHLGKWRLQLIINAPQLKPRLQGDDIQQSADTMKKKKW